MLDSSIPRRTAYDVPSRAGRRPGSRVLLALALVLLSLALIGFGPSPAWIPGLLDSMRVQLAATALVVVVIAGLRRSFRAGAVAAVAVVLNLAVLAPLYLAGPAAAAPESPRLTIASFNVKKWNNHTGELDSWLRQRPADVVVLIETTQARGRAAAAASGYRLVTADPTSSDPEIVVLSRVPASAARTVWLTPSTTRASVTVDTEIGGHPVRLLAMHPLSPRSPGAAEQRDADLRAAGRWAGAQDEPVVVVGDLNSTPWSRSYDGLLDRSALVDSALGFGVQPSWSTRLPVPFVDVPIDQLAYDPSLTVVDRETGPHLGSDHRPLVVTLALARGARG